MKMLMVVVSVVALAAIAVSGGSASASVVQCKTKVYTQASVFVTSARGLSCAAAAKEQRRYRWTGNNTFTTPGGYKCKPSGRGTTGYQKQHSGKIHYRAHDGRASQPDVA